MLFRLGGVNHQDYLCSAQSYASTNPLISLQTKNHRFRIETAVSHPVVSDGNALPTKKENIIACNVEQHKMHMCALKSETTTNVSKASVTSRPLFAGKRGSKANSPENVLRSPTVDLTKIGIPLWSKRREFPPEFQEHHLMNLFAQRHHLQRYCRVVYRPLTGVGGQYVPADTVDEIGPFYRPVAPLRTTWQRLSPLGPVFAPPPTAGPCRPASNSCQVGPDGTYDDRHQGRDYYRHQGPLSPGNRLPSAVRQRPPHTHLVDHARFAGLISQHYPQRNKKKATFNLVLAPE